MIKQEQYIKDMEKKLGGMAMSFNLDTLYTGQFIPVIERIIYDTKRACKDAICEDIIIPPSDVIMEVINKAEVMGVHQK